MGLGRICGLGRSEHLYTDRINSKKLDDLNRNRRSLDTVQAQRCDEVQVGRVQYVNSFGLPTLVAVYGGRSPVVVGSAIST